ncbi:MULTISPECIES: hypothetical protein [unclassified Solwaraspora]|uniref:hypothetical protein n=1 Tax=unclassified Solwaraspora TaxID=2627926 RepID=UPI00248C3D66|nr:MULTISPECIES: hypothetical protein [unclassified Solwaraspora]WBB98908.1 hypothetical protein O7553_08510 [Solwaraspora sp. WMMA2059]WBC22539.1 hypothetical protein O7543_08855 [Solwaraspora sp. WMMA2080]WJK35407.1 hypothetical protein O7610_03235 [Solwaraspora sp. WMMA2065]
MTAPPGPRPPVGVGTPQPRTALNAMLDRLPHVRAVVGERFPLYADPASGDWTSTRRGSWTGGFWAGLHWLGTAVRGDPSCRAAATEMTGRLAARAGDDTVTRAMTFWYGAAAVGGRICRDTTATRVALTGARALAGSFDAGPGVFPVGSAFGGPPTPRIGIDALAAVVALLCWADGPLSGARQLARRHAASCATLLVAADGQVLAERELPAVGAPSTDGEMWTRGQAWGMLGFAVAADRFGGDFTEVARRTADHWLAVTGQNGSASRVPPAVVGRAGAPPDTSAAAIAAAALWTLGGRPAPWAARYRSAATATTAALVTGHLAADGTLRDGCYDLDRAVAPRHEVVWGSYFLAAALAAQSATPPLVAW